MSRNQFTDKRPKVPVLYTMSGTIAKRLRVIHIYTPKALHIIPTQNQSSIYLHALARTRCKEERDTCQIYILKKKEKAFFHNISSATVCTKKGGELFHRGDFRGKQKVREAIEKRCESIYYSVQQLAILLYVYSSYSAKRFNSARYEMYNASGGIQCLLTSSATISRLKKIHMRFY